MPASPPCRPGPSRPGRRRAPNAYRARWPGHVAPPTQAPSRITACRPRGATQSPIAWSAGDPVASLRPENRGGPDQVTWCWQHSAFSTAIARRERGGFPAGSLESRLGNPREPSGEESHDDAIESSLRREVLEEFGIDIEIVRLAKIARSIPTEPMIPVGHRITISVDELHVAVLRDHDRYGVRHRIAKADTRSGVVCRRSRRAPSRTSRLQGPLRVVPPRSGQGSLAISAPNPRISKRFVITTAPSTAASEAIRCPTSKRPSSSSAMRGSVTPGRDPRSARAPSRRRVRRQPRGSRAPGSESVGALGCRRIVYFV